MNPELEDLLGERDLSMKAVHSQKEALEMSTAEEKHEDKGKEGREGQKGQPEREEKKQKGERKRRKKGRKRKETRERTKPKTKGTRNQKKREEEEDKKELSFSLPSKPDSSQFTRQRQKPEATSALVTAR